MQHHPNRTLRHDQAISPVIGTILMIAATVIIAGAVYGAVTLYSGKNTKAPVDASWKAQAIDTDNDGLEDQIKVTYVNGPTGAASSTVSLSVKNATGAGAGDSLATVIAHAGDWSPGDYATFRLQTGSVPPLAVLVTVTQSGNTMLDQQLTLRE